MEQFLGKFVFLPDKMEDIDGYIEALDLPAELRDLTKSAKSTTIALSQNSDGSYKDVTDFGGTETTFDFRLGEKSVATIAGYKTENVHTLEGNKLKGEHVDIPGGTKSTSTRYWEGDYLVIEFTLKGKTWKSYYQKV